MRILIDGDIITYRAACAVQKRFKEKDGNYSYEAEPESHAIYLASRMVQKIIGTLHTKFYGEHTYRVFLTADDKSNFRFSVATTKPYKGNRIVPKPIHYGAVRGFLQDSHNAEMITGMEADDALGINAVKHEDSIIVTIDKDLDQIPGWHFNFVKEKLFTVGPEEGLMTFCKQLLVGDPIDNIPGCPGIGIVRAVALLKGVNQYDQDEVLARVKKAYLSKFEDKEAGLAYLNEQSQLIWIRRDDSDYYPRFI